MFALLLQRAARLLTIRVLGWLFGVRKLPIYRAYERDMFNPKRQLLACAIVFPLSCLLAAAFLEPFHVLSFQSNFLYVAVVWNALIGGILVEGLENVISIVIIKASYDPNRIVWDNVLAILASTAVLLYFQNNWTSIASALTMGLFLNLFHKVYHSRPPMVLRAAPREN